MTRYLCSIILLLWIAALVAGCAGTASPAAPPPEEPLPPTTEPPPTVEPPTPTPVSPTPTPVSPTPAGPVSSPLIHGLAVVESVEILILESFPVQVHAVARGYTPDGCTEVDQILVERQDNLFRVTLTTVRPAHVACIEIIRPFERTIPLDVVGLLAGVYTVDVNGIGGAFTLTTDNVLPR